MRILLTALGIFTMLNVVACGDEEEETQQTEESTEEAQSEQSEGEDTQSEGSESGTAE